MNQERVQNRWLIRLLLIIIAAIGVVGLIGCQGDLILEEGNRRGFTLPFVADASAASPEPAGQGWAFEETFDGDPAAPSQALLPDRFEYVATHRTHAQEQFTKVYGPFPADHDDSCAGPNPDVTPLPQHQVYTIQGSNSVAPDESFFICKNHMMTALGEVDPYSLNAFWPRQEFDFSQGGTLEFEVNINLGHVQRSWWEIMIVPRDQMKFGAAPVEAAIDEVYPEDRIVFDFQRLVRRIKVGTGQTAPEGWLVNERDMGPYDWNYWNAEFPDDPALNDRRIRRTMRIEFGDEQLIWYIETEDGSFDEFVVAVPGGLPFDRGVVMFKTHAYTPSKDDNFDTFTFHWDNIRFDGPVLPAYEAYHADDYVYLQANGDRPVGDNETVNINIPRIGENMVLMGQLNQPMRGQVLLSINGGPDISVEPYEYARSCMSDDWASFRLELDPAWLQPGDNSFKWTIGPRADCATGPYDWDGFSVKFLHIQMDSDEMPLQMDESMHLPIVRREDG